MKRFDVIVIGTGQAGPSIAAKCAEGGLKTAIIEKHKFGGTCVNVGCTPTKTMVASARMAHMARRANDFGVDIPGVVTVDMKKVKSRKDTIVAKSNKGVEKWMKNTENLTVFEGHARFVGNKSIQVGDQLLQAEKIFINVGGRPRIPDGYDGIDFLTSDSILDLQEVPKQLLIIGGSYIGLEFGQMFKRFGSEVIIIEMSDRLVKREDRDVSEEIQRILKQEGIELRLGAECLNGRMDGDEIFVNLDCKKGAKFAKGSHLLLAVGRVPNTNDLGLENTDIKMNEKGYIETDDQLNTNVTGVWALGDCNGKGAFTHTAYNDFEIVAENIFGKGSRSVKDRILCYALFIDPALARIGITEEQARHSDKKIVMATRSMEKISRAREKGETDGFIKILVDAVSEKIVGASILGIEGDEIIHSLLDIMYAEKSYKTISRAVHIHPTVSELIPTMLNDLKPLD